MPGRWLRILLLIGGGMGLLIYSGLRSGGSWQDFSGLRTGQAGAQPSADRRPEFRTESLEILNTAGERIELAVEIAETPQQHAYGLMFRQALAPNAGMLFVYTPPRRVSFWMKNTPIPLDLVFVGRDGRVQRVAPRQTPYSKASIPSSAPVRAVLEINAGAAAAWHIGAGARLLHPAFDP